MVVLWLLFEYYTDALVICGCLGFVVFPDHTSLFIFATV